MIIGLTGKNGSGKGEAAAYLQKIGFEYHSLSDALRREAEKQGLECTRDNLYALGNRMRGDEGPGVLAARTLEGLDLSQNFVIDSIRHPAEVEVLRATGCFYLMVVTAPAEVRFERMKHRAREKDPQSLEAFLELESREAQSSNPSDQQLQKTLECGDVAVENKGSLELLYSQIDTFVRNPKAASVNRSS